MTEPKIRFKRDDGCNFEDIKGVPFGDVIEQYSIRTKEENEDILLSCTIDGVFLNSELFSHQRGSSNKGYKKIDKNTLILSAQNLHLGNANVNQRFEHGIISPAYNTYHIVGCNPDYLAQWIKREATKHFFYNATTTGASVCRRNVEWDTLYGQIFYLPCEEEQQKIADFLNNVDEIIAASEEEVANLEQQKKAMMQKIFSQEVRFKKDDGGDYPEWESKLFSDVFESLQNNTFSRDAMSYDNGIVRNIHYGDVLVKYGSVVDVSDVIVPFIKDGENVSKFRDESYLVSGDIVIADTAEDETVGKVTEILNASGEKVLAGLHTIPVRPREEFAKGFLGAYMNSEAYHSQLYKLMQGIKVTSVSKGAIADTFIFVPDIEEQKKIAEFFSDMDDAIASAKQELEKWKELKKGLLQQMFV